MISLIPCWREYLRVACRALLQVAALLKQAHLIASGTLARPLLQLLWPYPIVPKSTGLTLLPLVRKAICVSLAVVVGVQGFTIRSAEVAILSWESVWRMSRLCDSFGSIVII
jgi:hypothetical protein